MLQSSKPPRKKITLTWRALMVWIGSEVGDGAVRSPKAGIFSGTVLLRRIVRFAAAPVNGESVVPVEAASAIELA